MICTKANGGVVGMPISENNVGIVHPISPFIFSKIFLFKI